MKNTKLGLLFLSFLFSITGLYAQIPEHIWAESQEIEKQIKQTHFPANLYVITDFGATAGDASALCHEAINRAITTCSEQGAVRY